MIQRQIPTRALPDHPNTEQLKRQAKELLDAFRNGSADAAAEVQTHYRNADPATFALHDAQLVLARAYGFESWPKLKVFVDGVTVRRLVEAAKIGDLATVRSMVDARPEILHLDVAENDESQALHHAVVRHQPDIVRFLMQRGANARKGIYPHREATTALKLAAERGDDEIVAIIEEEEKRRKTSAPIRALPAQVLDRLGDAFDRNDEDAIIATLDAHPAVMRSSDETGRTALHYAARLLLPKLTAWLLDRGLEPTARANDGATPTDMLGETSDRPPAQKPSLIKAIASMLIKRGATRNARTAIAAGDTAWLLTSHADGTLVNGQGLVSHAIAARRHDMLMLLLDLGLDPDESGRVEGFDEVLPTWGGPLRTCAITGDLAAAEILLAHGANPNTNVYAASCALCEAYERRNEPMIALLERHGGFLKAVFVACLGLVDRAAKLVADAAAGRLAPGMASDHSSVEQDLLWGGIGNPEIVRLTLPLVDWPRDDRRWNWILNNGLYVNPEIDRVRHLEAFGLVLDRCDVNTPGKHGATLLHEVAASRGDLTPADRMAFTTLLLDRGAQLDVRDHLLESTPLGWACRWGRLEMVKLLLERGADPIEAGAPAWARPLAWARKMRHRQVAAVLKDLPRQ